MKPMTYRQLQEKIATLNAEQLDSPVFWWGDERGGVIYGVRILECRYINVGEGMEPESAYKDDMPEDGDIDAWMPKGAPILESDMGDGERDA